jgi:hypothetical protein
MYAPGPITKGVEPKSKKPIIILLASVTCVLIICLIVFVAVLAGFNGFHRDSGPTAGPPAVSAPPAPPGVPAPSGAPAPPPPPGTGSAEADGPLQAYIYPSSTKNMDATHNGKSVIQLTTNDSIDKVTDWYRARLKPSKTVQLPFVGTVMEGKDVKAVITGSEGGTMIILTKGED